MNKFFLMVLSIFLGMTAITFGAVIDFAGGTAYLSDGTTVVTDNDNTYYDVDYYIEDGFKIDFVNGYGIIGNYYGDGWPNSGNIHNSVIHAHVFSGIDIQFTKLDGTTMDLNYVDMTSNTEIGGGAATGNELSYITASNGSSMLLPSTDWGIDYLSTGQPGDGIVRLWLSSDFDGITSFLISSQNAYCFGMDNFYIDEEGPSPIPAPGALILAGAGSVIIGWLRRRKTI